MRNPAQAVGRPLGAAAGTCLEKSEGKGCQHSDLSWVTGFVQQGGSSLSALAFQLLSLLQLSGLESSCMQPIGNCSLS